MDANLYFQNTKEKVLHAILSSPNVSHDSAVDSCGIYLLYVDCFDDDKIIPFYIGKTTNFKRRFKQHLADIKELNALPYHEYHNAFLWGAWENKCRYEGKYKSCKIFKYMIEHGCSLNDLHMVILSTCPKEQLDEQESLYLNEFLPSFFGFNQIASITEHWRLNSDPQQLQNIEAEEASLFCSLMGYGFTEFNYLHAFRGSFFNNNKEALDENVSAYLQYDRLDELNLAVQLYKEYQRLFDANKPLMENLFSKKIREIFETYSIKSKARENDIISLLLNNIESPVWSDVSEIKDYLTYYMDRNRKCRECGTQLQNLFQNNLNQIILINSPVINAYKAYVNHRESSLRRSRFNLIFPNTHYVDFPLGK